MTKLVFYTIVTSSYVPQACVLIQSVQDHSNRSIDFYLFVVDEITSTTYEFVNKQFPFCHVVSGFSNFTPYLPDSRLTLVGNPKTTLRWTLKPLLAQGLINQGYSQVFYLDGDLWFVRDFSFLFAILEDTGILLSPHWRPIVPSASDAVEHEFICHLTHGLFNTGFFGATPKGNKILSWWSRLCLWRCEGIIEKGLWYDQRYLDFVPVYFPLESKVLTHKGCNTSLWNRDMLSRKIIDGEIYIENDPLVFLHINNAMITYAEFDDPVLYNLICDYKDQLTEKQKLLRHSRTEEL